MRIWADIYNAAGTALGRIKSLRDAQITRALDGAGRISFSLPLTDEQAQTLLQVERRVIISTLDGNDNGIREVGRGIITKLGVSAGSSGWLRTIHGVDELQELKRISTLLARKYDDEQIDTIGTSLIALASGWSFSSSITDQTIARFDGESVLKALQMLAEQSGNHIRVNGAKTVQLGAFGTASGLRAIHRQRVPHELYTNDNVVLIESFRQEQDSAQMFNWILPLMSGMGEAAVGLGYSNRATPYTIQSATGPDGSTYYYLADSTSITSYGTIQRVAKFTQIAPLSNTATALELAANALYDAAVAQLQRYKDPQAVYTITVRKVWGTTLLPGDTIHVRYLGFVEDRDGNIVNYVDIDDEFWILDVTERFGVEGSAVDLKISNIDRRELSTAEIIVGKLDSMIVNGLRVEPYFSRDIFTDKFEVDSTHSATFQLDLTDAVQRTVRIKMRLLTSPFRTTAQATAATTTPIKFAGVSSGAPATEPVYWRNFRMYDGSSMVNHGLLYPHATAEDTYETRPGTDDTHTHDITYGIEDDSTYPDALTITINGTDRTNALAGAATINTSGAAYDNTFDITEYINANANNTIVIACGSGQGLAKIIVEEYLVIQSIKVT